MPRQARTPAPGVALRLSVTSVREIARYRHAQLSVVRLAGDINAKVTDSASLDELLVSIKSELTKLGLIDLEVVPQGSRTEGGLTVGSRTIEHAWRSRLEPNTLCSIVLVTI
jgi:hypothetical protein